MKKIYLFVLITLSTLFLLTNNYLKVTAQDYTNLSSTPSEFLEDRYTNVYESWSAYPLATNFETVVTPHDFIDSNLIRLSIEESQGYSSEVIRLESNGEVTFTIDAPETAIYEIMVDYYDESNSILPQHGAIKINGDYPFYEARQLVFPSKWQPATEHFQVDRYNNELLPASNKTNEWLTTSLLDGSFFHSEPLRFKLDQGINEIKIISKTGYMLIGNITVGSPKEAISYAEYYETYKHVDKVKFLRTFETEYIEFKSDASVRLYSDMEPSSSRYDTKHKLLNAVEPNSWRKGGQSLTWDFNVDQTGLYKINIKYLQSLFTDMPVYRSIKIDGEIPFSELQNYPFHYTKDWKNEVLHGINGDYYFYLTAGNHTLTMTVTLDPYRPIIEDIDRIMDEINDLTLKIKKLTGNKIDPYRDWKITDYIPDIEQRIIGWADDLDKQFTYGNRLNLTDKEAGELMYLKIASNRLRVLAKDPNQIPNRLSELSEGTSSIAQLLGDQMFRLMSQPLGVEKFFVFHDERLPDPMANFFVRLWEGIKRFFLSFFPDGYSASNSANGELEVWVNKPRQYVELLQQMIDNDFTPKTGIKVKLSIMPDENKLILANAANTQPDVVMGVNHWIPYELALRGAAKDLRQFDGYEELISQFTKGAIIPYVYEDGVYAIPETQDFWLTFYRSDILGSLNLPVPDTWNDVVGILPELQRNGMNFYEPISLYTGLKPFVATLPFIYQFGGELYSEDGARANLDSEEMVEAIKFMTDLFRIYNLPKQVPNFYHHFRFGTLPIGIANSNTYIQLTVAAPEIKGNWEVALHPGVMNDEGVVERWAPVGGQAIMISEKTIYPQQSFDFIEWWMSEPIQTQFAQSLQTMYGEEYLWTTANIEAFKKLPIPEEHKAIILEQWEWGVEASRVPGAYMVEREISDAWSKVVFNNANVRTTLDDALIRANREIARKMEEFGYMKDGVMIKEYKIPTIYNIDQWLTERRKDE